MSTSDPLLDFVAYLKRETDRRAEGKNPGVVRLRDDEIAALLKLLLPVKITIRGGARG